MPKALADMTPEERRECVGMWCDYPNRRGKIGVIYDIDRDGNPMVLRFGVTHEILGFDAKDVTPRLDLPRAWEPDWSPVKGHWETSYDWGIVPQTRRYVTESIPLEEDI